MRTLAVLLFVAMGIAACATVPPPATAGEAQVFPLHKEQQEPAITACREAAMAIELWTLTLDGKPAQADALYKKLKAKGECVDAADVPVTYIRQVWKRTAHGQLWTVYEGRVGSVTVYVPMLGWTHKE